MDEHLSVLGKSKKIPASISSSFSRGTTYVFFLAELVIALLVHWIASWIILVIDIIKTMVGYLQEAKAEKIIDAVRNMLSVLNRVSRKGEKRPQMRKSFFPAIFYTFIGR